MLQRLGNKKGQSVAGQYVILFFVVIGAIMAMSVYFRRALQGRIYDAQKYAITQAQSGLGNSIAMEYEPYYAEMITNATQDVHDGTRVQVSEDFYLYNKTIDQVKDIDSTSTQLPPKEAR